LFIRLALAERSEGKKVRGILTLGFVIFFFFGTVYKMI